jgi:hypothetical protein
VKFYTGEKTIDANTGWQHTRIVLEPVELELEPIVLTRQGEAWLPKLLVGTCPGLNSGLVFKPIAPERPGSLPERRVACEAPSWQT